MADYYMVAGEYSRVMGLVEIDIDKARKRISEIKEKDNYSVSLTGWAAKILAKVVSQDMRFNSFRKGKRKIVQFEEIDCSIMIEIPKKNGGMVPYNHCIRNIDKKSVRDITDEIKNVKQKQIEARDQLKTSRSSSTYMLVPGFLRRMVMKRLLKNPFYVKKIMGTIGITSLAGSMPDINGFVVSLGDKTVNLALGAISKRVVEIEKGNFETHEILGATFIFDHEVVDGGPMGRFVNRMTNFMKEATYLADIDQKE
jgi:pyruvate/2-oxoglutarate dehydrogenase complex dihydrolipoamide acyltransferase (E2) component